MDKKDGLIPQDDYEFEQELALKESQLRSDADRTEQERSEQEKKERSEYEKQLQDRKIELIKLKQGVIESSDIVSEQHEEKKRLGFFEYIENVWYRSKWLIVFAAVMIFAVVYIAVDSAGRVSPDYTVLVVTDNYGLYYRSEEMQSFMEGFCDDINGDGEVSVLVYNIMTDYSDLTNSTAYQAQLMSQLQSGDNIILISNGSTDFEVHDFTGELEGEFVTKEGLKFNCALTREKLKWSEMPQDLYISMREPAKLLSTPFESMKRNYDEALPVFERIYEAIKNSEP